MFQENEEEPSYLQDSVPAVSSTGDSMVAPTLMTEVK